MDVSYFRPRRSGPEAVVEDAVADQIQSIFHHDSLRLWTAGSPSIGAGMPDLVVVSFKPEVLVLSQVEIPTTNIIAYLRAVGTAHADMIIKQVGMSEKTTLQHLNRLIEFQILSKIRDTYSLQPTWKQILTDITTIEVKIQDWKKAIQQALRNRIFANRSYVAFPEKLAQRVLTEPIFTKSNIGLISVDGDGIVNVLLHARRRKPKVWKYYYEIALLAAKNNKDFSYAL